MSDSSDSDGVPLVEQIAEEYLGRLRRGEGPTIDEYVARHPGLEDELRDLLPTLQFLEDFKPVEGDSQRGESAEPGTLPAPLQQVGEYRILKEIGRGGMGVVYEAEQLSLGRHVALKVLPKRAVRDDVAIERFQREARAAARLQHPNIVPIIDIGSEGEVNYYAMQFVRGRSLNEITDNIRDLRGESAVPAAQVIGDTVGQAERLDSSTMGGRQYWRSVAHIGVQVSRALEYAHARGVIHRDVKPSNLLLDDEGTLWVTDFGLAKTGDDGLTLTGDVVGTIRYMSPERFKGQCDERADVFSVGATLYELLVLEPAFHSPDRLRLIERITKEDPSNPRSIDPSVPVDLETIVLKALEKDPRRRYQNAKDLCDDLSRFLRHQPIRARRTSAFGRGWRWAARNRALAVTAACLLTTLLAVAVSAVVVAFHMGELAEDANSARSTIERQLYRSQLEGAVRAIDNGRLSLARRRLDEAPEELRGWEWRHVASRLEGGVGSPIPQQRLITWVQFAPDADLALIRSTQPDGSECYQVVKTADWQPIFEVPCGPRNITAVLSRDGTELALTGDSLEVWNVVRRERIVRRAEPSKYYIRLSADDYLHPTASWLERRELATGVERQRIDGPPWWAGVDRDREHLVVAFEHSVGLFRVADMTEVGERISLPSAGTLLSGSISADGRMVAISTAGGTFHVFSIGPQGLREQHAFRNYVGSPSAMCFSNDSRFVVLGTRLGGLYVWDLETGELERQFFGHQSPIRGLAVHPDSGVLVSCDSDGSHRGWSFEAESYDVLRGHTSYVYPVTYSADGQRLVSGGWDGFQNEPGSLRFWDAATGAPIVARLDPGQFVSCLAAAPGRVLAGMHTTAGAAYAAVHDELSGELLHQFGGHGNDRIVRACMHPDGRQVLTLGAYEKAILWDLASGEVAREWRLYCDGMNGQAAAFSPDGRWLALSAQVADVRIIDLSTGVVRRKWLAHNQYISDLAFSADGQSVFSSSFDDSIAKWSLDGALQGQLLGHGVDVMCMALSPDGARLASGGRDGDLLLWDLEHLEQVARFTGHTDYIYDCAWSPTGQRLVTASGDKTLRLWTTDTMASQARARRERLARIRRIEPKVAAQIAAGKSSADIWRRWNEEETGSAAEREVVRQLLMQRAPTGR